MKKYFIGYAIVITIIVLGEVQCIYKAITCNWEPVGKAEVIYTIGALSGLGAIVGWFNIEDN